MAVVYLQVRELDGTLIGHRNAGSSRASSTFDALEIVRERFEGLPGLTARHGEFVCDLEDGVRYILLVGIHSLFFVERARFLVDAYRSFPKERPTMPEWDARWSKRRKPKPPTAERLA
jgi:hypothetical protein